VSTEPRQINRCERGLNIWEPNKPVRSTLAMMLAEAGLDAFFTMWNGVRRPFKKDDQIPAILLMFCKSQMSLQPY